MHSIILIFELVVSFLLFLLPVPAVTRSEGQGDDPLFSNAYYWEYGPSLKRQPGHSLHIEAKGCRPPCAMGTAP